MLFIVVSLILLINPSQTQDTCSNDNQCPYYCDGDGKCQKPVPRGHHCSGYTRHTRECDIAAWCDPDQNLTCRLLKNIEEKCKYDYSCIDNYCDLETNTCQYRKFIDEQCHTNRSCHSYYCETDKKTCQSMEEQSLLPKFISLVLICFILHIFDKNKTVKIDVTTQTNDVQHAPEDFTQLN
ncbi:unnamed protein product [Rotaria socialis]